MGVMQTYIEKINDILRPFLEPILNKVVDFIQGNKFLALAGILLFLALVFLVGFIRWLRKAPKLFVFILILCAIAVTLGILF